MAAKKSLSWTLVDQVEKLEEVVKDLKKKSVLFVDAEGVELGRVGKLCLLQIATDEKTYLFDVVALDKKPFESGLKRILEDAAVTKVFFDCREDCNALKHQFNILVKGIQDLQLMNAIRRKLTGQKWNFLCGFKKCMETFLPDVQSSQADKEIVRKKMDGDKQIWSKRPLTDDLLRYAAGDVFYLSHLKDKLNAGLSLSNHQVMEKMLPYSSERYAAFLRDNPYYSRDCPYIRNARIPEGIIPNVSSGSSFIKFKDEGIRCIKCYQYTDSTRDICPRCRQIALL